MPVCLLSGLMEFQCSLTWLDLEDMFFLLMDVFANDFVTKSSGVATINSSNISTTSCKATANAMNFG